MRHKESGRLLIPIHFSFSQDFLSEIKRLDTGYSSPHQPPHPLSYLGPGHHGHIFHDFRNFVSIQFSRRTFRNRNHVLTGNLSDDRFVHPGAFLPLTKQPGRSPHSAPIWRAVATERVGGEPPVRAGVSGGFWGRRLPGSGDRKCWNGNYQLYSKLFSGKIKRRTHSTVPVLRLLMQKHFHPTPALTLSGSNPRSAS